MCIRDRLGVKESHQPRSHASGGAAARSIQDILAQILLDHLAEPAQSLIQQGQILGLGPLLGPEHIGRAMRSAQGVGHIAGHPELGLAHLGIHGRKVDGMKLQKPRRPRRNRNPILVQQLGPQRCV